MHIRLLVLGILLFVSGELCALSDYTVIANDRLNVRLEPNVKSKIIKTLSPFELVESEMNHEMFINEQLNSKLIIHGRSGFWMKIVSKTVEGYIFSPYVLPGDYHSYLNESMDYSMLETGIVCSAEFKYNPALVWYLVDSDADRYLLRKVKVRLQTNYGDDSFKNPDAYGRVVGINVSVAQGNFSGRLLGVRYEIDEFEGATFLKGNVLLDSTRSANVIYGDTAFCLKSKYESDNEYNVIYTRLGGDGTFFHQDLNANIYPSENYSTLVNFGEPRLVYFGDINNDGEADVIISSNNLPEGCGVEWKYHLFVSSGASIRNSLQHSIIGANGACN